MISTSEHMVGFVTAPDVAVARKIVRAALESKLVACANLVPQIESHYWWQGKIEMSAEVMIIFKTIRDRKEQLETCIRQNHPYEVPEIVLFSLSDGHEPYLSWISKSLD